MARLRARGTRLRPARRPVPCARRHDRSSGVGVDAGAGTDADGCGAALARPARGRDRDRLRPGLRAPARLGDADGRGLPARRLRARAARRARLGVLRQRALEARRRVHPRRLRAPVRPDRQLRALVWAHDAGGLGAPAVSRSCSCSSASDRRSGCCPSRRASLPCTAPLRECRRRRSRSRSTPASTASGGSASDPGAGPGLVGRGRIVLGGLGALVGILYAVTQDEIVRFLGFSSVEHGGIVLLGFGVGLLGQSAHKPRLAAAGLVAATLHLVMHGARRPSPSSAPTASPRPRQPRAPSARRPRGAHAGVPRPASGSRSLTLAAMPPFGGFVSEWFTLRGAAPELPPPPDARAPRDGARRRDARAHRGDRAACVREALRRHLPRRPRTRSPAYASRGGRRIARLAASRSSSARSRRGRSAGSAAASPACSASTSPGTTIHFPLVLGPVYRLLRARADLARARDPHVPDRRCRCSCASSSAPRCGAHRSGSPALPADVARVQYTPEAYANPIRVVLAHAYGFAAPSTRRTTPTDASWYARRAAPSRSTSTVRSPRAPRLSAQRAVSSRAGSAPTCSTPRRPDRSPRPDPRPPD